MSEDARRHIIRLVDLFVKSTAKDSVLLLPGGTSTSAQVMRSALSASE